MKQIFRAPLIGLLALSISPAFAADIVVHDATNVLPIVAGRPGAGYLEIENTGKTDDTLLSVAADKVDHVEVHHMMMKGNVMEMRPLKSLAVKAGETVKLAKGGYHLMLFGVDTSVKAGDKGELTLTFEHAGKVTAPVTWTAP